MPYIQTLVYYRAGGPGLCGVCARPSVRGRDLCRYCLGRPWVRIWSQRLPGARLFSARSARGAQSPRFRLPVASVLSAPTAAPSSPNCPNRCALQPEPLQPLRHPDAIPPSRSNRNDHQRPRTATHGLVLVPPIGGTGGAQSVLSPTRMASHEWAGPTTHLHKHCDVAT